MIERTHTDRVMEKCPKCGSKLKAIIDNSVVCVGISCSHIYRTDALTYRKDDKTFVELKKEFNG